MGPALCESDCRAVRSAWTTRQRVPVRSSYSWVATLLKMPLRLVPTS
jgi:hypothetical protein